MQRRQIKLNICHDYFRVLFPQLRKKTFLPCQINHFEEHLLKDIPKLPRKTPLWCVDTLIYLCLQVCMLQIFSFEEEREIFHSLYVLEDHKPGRGWFVDTLIYLYACYKSLALKKRGKYSIARCVRKP